jgi:hypothetical protein
VTSGILIPDDVRSAAGRKPADAIVLFRMLVLQAPNNLSDEQVEYQVGDRLSFSRFLRRPRSAQSSEDRRGGESEKESGSCSRRARVRCSADLTGRSDRADDRNRQSTSKDRIAKPRLQHPSSRDTRTDGRRMKVESV